MLFFFRLYLSEAFGTDDDSTLDTMRCLGSVYFKQRRLKEADELLNTCLEVGYGKWTPDHPFLVSVKSLQEFVRDSMR
jgi:hypothetical protein